MLFSDPDYGIFLLAVFFLYGLSRATARHDAMRRAARTALMFLLADLIFVLITKSPSQLWSPLSGIAVTLLSGHDISSLPWLRYLVGTGVMAGAVFVGRRYGGSLDSAAGRVFTGAVMTLVVAILGFAVLAILYWQPWYLRLDEVSSVLASCGHIVMLMVIGVAIGASQMASSRALGRILILFVVSALFYQGWAASKHGAYCYMLLVLLGTIILDFYLALGIDRSQSPRWRRALLVISLLSNLGILGLFKYADFFARDVLGLNVEPLHLILPAGISFHTFQSMSYTIDVYRRQLPATSSPLHFASFVLFFPQLVAGPIVRAVDLLPQLGELPRLDQTLATRGLFRIAVGLFKKIVIADTLGAVIVSRVFANPSQFSSLEVAAGVVGFAFQLYNDFSGYSDIAIGSAQVLGFELPENFRTPYRAGNLQEFWRRWHISLSTWLRDYLYISLGGDRRGAWQTYRNLLLTMFIGGLWHGAKWTYVVWGALHGGGLAITRWYQRRINTSQHVVLLIVLTVLWAAMGLMGHLWLLAQPEGVRTWVSALVIWTYAAPMWALLTVLLSKVESIPKMLVVGSSASQRQLAPLLVMAITCGFALYAMSSLSTITWLPSVLAVWMCAVLADRSQPLQWRFIVARTIACSLVFSYVCLAWIFFRASSCQQAFAIISRLTAMEWDSANVTPMVRTLLVVALLAHWFPDRVLARLRQQFCQAPAIVQGTVLALAVLLLRALAEPHFAPFFYNEF
jgi:D-alanyl-lipoteichoic acid acyltransferase DltB (MBOAT superfamily)